MGEGSADSITIDETGLITADEAAEHEDEGYPVFTVNGYDPDEQGQGYIKVVAQQ